MLNLSITLIHNKSEAENQAQIEAIKKLLKEVVDGPFTNEETGETWTTIHHEFTFLEIPHSVKIYQIVPFGVTPPPNRSDINSGGIVYYGAGDEDKVGDHPRFFNWGLKRGTDYGAEINIYLDDVKKLNKQDLPIYLNSLIDPEDPHELVEDTGVKLASLKLLKEVGQLKEDRTLTQAFTDLKSRVTEKGLQNG